jgi:deoxyribonuclease V
MPAPKIAMDVAYGPTTATVSAVAFAKWTDDVPLEEWVTTTPVPDEYQPGEFYLRELPCLIALLPDLPNHLSTIVVDGYVWLGTGRMGLGAHLYAALGRTVPIVGVAKAPHRGNDIAIAVRRGGSMRPIFVTATGMPATRAAAAVGRMAGPHRIPTLLRRADQLARRPGG